MVVKLPSNTDLVLSCY